MLQMDFKSSSRRRPHVNVFGCCQKHVNNTVLAAPLQKVGKKSPHCAVSQILDFVDIFEFGELLLTKKTWPAFHNQQTQPKVNSSLYFALGRACSICGGSKPHQRSLPQSLWPVRTCWTLHV